MTSRTVPTQPSTAVAGVTLSTKTKRPADGSIPWSKVKVAVTPPNAQASTNVDLTPIIVGVVASLVVILFIMIALGMACLSQKRKILKDEYKVMDERHSSAGSLNGGRFDYVGPLGTSGTSKV